MYRNLKFLHMTDFFSTDTVRVSVTNMRYGVNQYFWIAATIRLSFSFISLDWKEDITFPNEKSLHLNDLHIKQFFWGCQLISLFAVWEDTRVQVHLKIEAAKKTVKRMQKMRSKEMRIKWPLYRDNRLLPRATKLSHFSLVL